VQSEQAIEIAQRASRGEVGRLAIDLLDRRSLLPAAVAVISPSARCPFDVACDHDRAN